MFHRNFTDEGFVDGLFRSVDVFKSLVFDRVSQRGDPVSHVVARRVVDQVAFYRI